MPRAFMLGHKNWIIFSLIFVHISAWSNPTRDFDRDAWKQSLRDFLSLLEQVYLHWVYSLYHHFDHEHLHHYQNYQICTISQKIHPDRKWRGNGSWTWIGTAEPLDKASTETRKNRGKPEKPEKPVLEPKIWNTLPFPVFEAEPELKLFWKKPVHSGRINSNFCPLKLQLPFATNFFVFFDLTWWQLVLMT